MTNPNTNVSDPPLVPVQPQAAVVSHQEQKLAVFMGFTLMQAIFVIFWPLAAMAGAWYLLINPRLNAIEAGLKSRPSIHVADIRKRVNSHVQQGKTASEAVHAVENEFKRLSAHGYVVLPADSVMSAPDEVRD